MSNKQVGRCTLHPNPQATPRETANGHSVIHTPSQAAQRDDSVAAFPGEDTGHAHGDKFLGRPAKETREHEGHQGKIQGKQIGDTTNATTKNIISVLKNGTIAKLKRSGYQYCYLLSGFIAHYDINGFKAYYSSDYKLFVDDLASGLKDALWVYKRDYEDPRNDKPDGCNKAYYKDKLDTAIELTGWIKENADLINKNISRELSEQDALSKEVGRRLASEEITLKEVIGR